LSDLGLSLCVHSTCLDSFLPHLSLLTGVSSGILEFHAQRCVAKTNLGPLTHSARVLARPGLALLFIALHLLASAAAWSRPSVRPPPSHVAPPSNDISSANTKLARCSNPGRRASLHTRSKTSLPSPASLPHLGSQLQIPWLARLADWCRAVALRSLAAAAVGA
jgi:hypothetical protein